MSVAQFPKEILPEYRQVCEDVEYILKKAFGEKKIVSFFEHGSGPSGMSAHKKSIVHAHTHVVVGYPIQKKYLEMVQMKPIEDISVAAHTHYFSYQEGSNGQLVACYDSEVYVQRQFPRQVIAEQIGLAPGQYNWRNVAFSENIKASLHGTVQRTLGPIFKIRTQISHRLLPFRIRRVGNERREFLTRCRPENSHIP